MNTIRREMVFEVIDSHRLFCIVATSMPCIIKEKRTGIAALLKAEAIA
jgi:hypothetical protein